MATDTREGVDINDMVDNPFSSDPFKFAHGLTGVDQEGNYLFTDVLLLTFVALCAITFICCMMNRFTSHLRHISVMGNPERQRFWAHNRSVWWPSLKKHLIYAPLWNVRHNREIQLSKAISVGTLPSRFELMFLILYISSNIAYCLVLPYSDENVSVIIAALRGRSGTLATINLVPTVLFALRNNPLIWMLHVSYDTFNLFHRCTARIVIVESVVHVIAWLVNTHNSESSFSGVLFVLEESISYRWGLAGVLSFIFMGIQAWSPIRHAFYETFLNIHKIAAIVAILGVYYHLKLHALPQVPFMMIVFSLWVAEYFFRIARVTYYNISFKRSTNVTVEALPGEACRVTFDLVHGWSPRPGAHVHCYLPSISWISSHPFSVAWTQKAIRPPFSEKLPESEADIYMPPSKSTSISVVMRVRTGMTRKLYNKAITQNRGVWRTFGAIEGPYGGNHSLDSYGTILLFAAGVGITHQLLFLRSLVQGFGDGTVGAQKVTLVWCIPDTEALEWIRPWMDDILRLPSRRDVLKVHLFISNPKYQLEFMRSASGSINMHPGRCNPQTVIDTEVRERIGAMAVTVCGPGAFSDSVRAATRRVIESGYVDYIEEAFTY